MDGEQADEFVACLLSRVMNGLLEVINRHPSFSINSTGKNKNHHHHLFNQSPKHHKSAPNRRPGRCLSPPEVKQDLKSEMMVVVMVVAMVVDAIICCWRHHLATNLTDPTPSTIPLRFVLAIDEDDGGGWCFEQV
ncbi:hypothetical protein QVD17_28194 [Tagetes erecta]|uniref:Uncharacterized protein n=1 Tax=Tagetes erecta TaxID=13708 RepID=A0AAD8KAJ7_TARER|nr:hypothetical protein QVD17_28194 [Tagetes erecta]